MKIQVISPNEMEQYASSFCTLYNMTFNGHIDKDIFLHRFCENPYADICICAAFENDKLIANYSVSPRRIIVEGKEIKAAQSIHTMTHPDYMGKGLFVTLAQKLFIELENNNYELVYGFPNYMSNGIFNTKLGWCNIYECPTMALDLDVMEESRIKKTVFKVSDIINIEKLEFRNTNKVCVKKDMEYLRWRYSNKTGMLYRVIVLSEYTWCIVKHYMDNLNVVELHYVTNTDLEESLNAILLYAKKQNMRYVTTWSSINTELHSVLERYKFRNNYPITYFSAKILGNSNFDYFDHRVWNIQMGDDNVY